jgi:hypothetical protein
VKKTFALALVAIITSTWATPAAARVVQLEVQKRTPFNGARTFGAVGPYERLEGLVRFEVDPADPLNVIIVNLDKAPRNARGRVEFSTDFVILKPVDPSRGNHKILYGVNNRGNNLEIDAHSYPAFGTDPPIEFGDGFLFKSGYTFVDAGWAGDVVTSERRRGATLPVAQQADGRPVVAPIRIEYSASGFTHPLKGTAAFRSYETADADTTRSTLTVRDAIDGPRQKVPADAWAFGRCPTGRDSLVPTKSDICVFGGFTPGRLYELIYPATGPWVMGLGYAVTRDLGSFLRYSVKDDTGHANPLAVATDAVGIRRMYGTGTSSTGMYLRDFLYLGFNEDEGHRKVFDAVRIAIPGTHRLFANVEFADPNIYSGQDQHHDFVSYSHPPLTYAVTTDPITGVRDGILKRPATDPLVLHVDTANEFWQMNASLNVHDGRGRPVPIPDNVRLYFLPNHSHTGSSGVGFVPAAGAACRYPVNGRRSTRNAVFRALLVVLDDWADRGVAPPASRYPTVDAGTLVTLAEAAAAFPKLPGVQFPTVANQLQLLDFGPSFNAAGGKLTVLPPKRGERYELRVPKPEADGTDSGGIRTVDVAAPVGTNLGWNLRPDGSRETDLCWLSGSFIPLARTRAERMAAHDDRLSLEERYGDHAGFVQAVRIAARQLVNGRFLLAEDADTMIAEAEQSGILR